MPVDQNAYYPPKSRYCYIMLSFAGETGAGKSTLLNLLLGELATELLPVAHMSSTSAICELKYCDKGKLVIHSRDPSEEPKTVDLEKDSAAQTISRYVHQKGIYQSGIDLVTIICGMVEVFCKSKYCIPS